MITGILDKVMVSMFRVREIYLPLVLCLIIFKGFLCLSGVSKDLHDLGTRKNEVII